VDLRDPAMAASNASGVRARLHGGLGNLQDDEAAMTTQGRRAPLRRIKLDASQQRYWQDTLAALSWIAPGFVHVIYTMLNNTGDDDVALFTEDGIMKTHAAATDGWQLIFNPKLFFQFDLMERCFIVLHEVMHEALNHVRMGYHFKQRGQITMGGKTLPYSHTFANWMQDFVINAILVAAKMGKYHKNWLLDPKIADENTMWIDAYFKEWPNVQHIKVVGMHFDAHLDPHEGTGQSPEEAPARNDPAWEIVMNQAAEIQRAQGKMPAAMQRFFDSILRPKVDWTDHVRGHITRIMGSGAYDFGRLDRRLITRGLGAPGMSGHGAGLVIIGGDTSMSVFQSAELVHRWIGEIAGMIEDVQPEETHVVWCDTVVKRVDICTDVQDVRNMIYRGVPGGGGTIFMPVFKYIEDNDLRPDVLLYLTDGDGTFPPHEPDYPVIWGDISGEKEKYPFGTVVHIPGD
jgi:predicted metal-dependent peptidase